MKSITEKVAAQIWCSTSKHVHRYIHAHAWNSIIHFTPKSIWNSPLIFVRDQVPIVRYMSDDIVSGLSEHLWESVNDSIFEQTRNFLIVYDCEF